MIRATRTNSTAGVGGLRLPNLLALSALLLWGCAGETRLDRSGPASSATTVVRGGSLFDGTGDRLVRNPGLVIADGRFVAADGAAARRAIGEGATVIDVAEDEVILPGFFDLHAHYHLDLRGEGRVDETEVNPSLFLANGVVNTFPAGEVQPERMGELKRRIEAGEQPGPRIHRSGPYFGSARVGWDPEISAEQIREEVDYWVAQGVAGFKAKGITEPHLRALVERAHHHGVTVTGHLGSGSRGSVNPRDAIRIGIDRVEHFMGGDAMTPDRSAYASLVEMTPDMPEFERIARLYIDEGVYFDATMHTYGYYGERDPAVFTYFQDEMSFLTPYARKLVEERAARRGGNAQFDRIYQVKQPLVRRFYELGGGHLITLGTDHPSWGEYFSGFAVHRELHVFVRAGIPEAAALKFGTINAARALGVDQDLGTIEVGKIADLVVVRGNPLDDIRNTRNVRLVMKEGVTHDPEALLEAVRGRMGPEGPEQLSAW